MGARHKTLTNETNNINKKQKQDKKWRILVLLCKSVLYILYSIFIFPGFKSTSDIDLPMFIFIDILSGWTFVSHKYANASKKKHVGTNLGSEGQNTVTSL